MFESLNHHPLPSPAEVRNEFPCLPEWTNHIRQSRSTIQKIFIGQESKIFLAIGPCSIHNYDEAIEFAKRLKKLSQETSDTFHIAMRVNFEKPRTLCGWKGLLHDSELSGVSNLQQGMILVRKLLLEIASLGLPIATELLDPFICCYVGDLISWGWIGSRTSESQIHRQLVSGLPFPIGFKNSTDGSVEGAVCAVKASSIKHSFLSFDEYGKISNITTKGNANTHLILRGGKFGPNFDRESQNKAAHLLKSFDLPERMMVDCSHDNSRGDHKNQPRVFASLIEEVREGNPLIFGLMLESNLRAGRQETAIEYGISITDECMGWEETEDLIHQNVQKILSISCV